METDNVENTGRYDTDSLRHLQILEEEAMTISSEEEATWKREQEIELMRMHIERLKEKRDDLKKRVKDTPRKVLENCVAQYMNLKSPRKRRHLRNIDKEQIRNSVLIARNLKAEEVCSSYRLTGATVAPITNQKVRVCWDTFFQGEFLESFYAELDIAHDSKILKHSIPFFVPVEKIAEENLPREMNKFVQTVTGYLNSYITRRQQAIQLQAALQVHLIEEIHTGSAFDFMQFYIKLFADSDGILETRLTYSDLLDVYPSKVVLRVTGDVEDMEGLRGRLLVFREDIRQMYLQDAVTKLLSA